LHTETHEHITVVRSTALRGIRVTAEQVAWSRAIAYDADVCLSIAYVEGEFPIILVRRSSDDDLVHK
jgi:hypothetical protein